MATAKLTTKCLQDKEAAKAVWAWEKPALDGVFNYLYKNYSDGKTPEVSQAERTSLIDLTNAANKKFGLGIDPDKFVNIIIACLPSDLPALPKKYDIEKDAQKAGNNEDAMVPYDKGTLVPNRTSWQDHLMTVMHNPSATPGEIAKFLWNIPRGSRWFWLIHVFSVFISFVLLIQSNTIAVHTINQAKSVSPALDVLTEQILGDLNIEEQGYVKYVFKAFVEGCKSSARALLGEGLIPASKATALSALSSGAIALVAVVQDAAIDASEVCGQTTYANALIASISGSGDCVKDTMKLNLRHQSEKLQSLSKDSYGKIYYITTIAVTMGSISTFMLATEVMRGAKGLIKNIKKIRGNQLAEPGHTSIEHDAAAGLLALGPSGGSKKSRRKSRKKTKKRAHKKPMKSRKKTGRRSRKTGRRSRKTGNRKRR
jgi:hypothetical protein